MGMYTEICTNLMVQDPEVVKILMWMVAHNFNEKVPEELPDHEFFRCDRWTILLKGGSAYFDDYLLELTCIEEEHGVYHLKTISNIKNYSQEIKKFAEWIRPYCSPQMYPIVTEEYEETRDCLTRYYQDGRVERDPTPKDYYD